MGWLSSTEQYLHLNPVHAPRGFWINEILPIKEEMDCSNNTFSADYTVVEDLFFFNLRL